MKIAFAINNQNEKRLNSNFGRAKYFLVIDPKTLEERYIDNEGFEATGGAGIKAAQTLINEKIDGLVAFQLGENAGNLIEKGKIEIKRANTDEIDELVSNYNNLDKLQNYHSGFHGEK